MSAFDANTVFPFDLRWSPEQLAEAVPLRPHELDVFARPLPTTEPATHRRLRCRYAPVSAFPATFRIHG